jgi:hypothetical protein
VNRLLSAALAGALLIIANAPAAAEPEAGDLFRASDGYTYFHRAGADMAAHDAAVADCARKAGELTTDILSVETRPVGVIIGGGLHAVAERQNWQANVESCMLAGGWEVVRVGDDEGKRISAHSPAEQAVILAPWVGAAEIHGELARTFTPLNTLWPLRRPAPSAFSPIPPPSLSLTEGAHDSLAPPLPMLDARDLGASADTQTAPDASVIVIRMWTSAPRHQSVLVFGKIDEAKGGVQKAELFKVASPVRFLWGPGPLLQTTYVIPVEPGRWRLVAAAQVIRLCLGQPTFEVGPGEAVFAGSFDAAADDILAPDMSLQPAVATLRDSALAARLRPARWTNGATSRCDMALNPGGQLYRYDMPGASADASLNQGR